MTPSPAIANGGASRYSVPACVVFLTLSLVLAIGAPASAHTAPDVIRPGAPANVEAASSRVSNNIIVTWDRATDNVGIAEYRILRNGLEIAEVDGAQRRVTLTDLPHGTSFLQLQAIDAASNASVRTRPTAIVVDRVAPSAPSNLEVEVTGGFECCSPPLSYATGWVGFDAPQDAGGMLYTYLYIDGQRSGPDFIACVNPPGTRCEVPFETEAGVHSFQLEFIDMSGNVSARSQPVIADVRFDSSAPAAAIDPTVRFDNGDIVFDWSPATDPNVARFEIIENFRPTTADGFSQNFVVPIATVDATDTSVRVAARHNGSHEFELVAVSTIGNRSPVVNLSLDVPFDASRSFAPAIVLEAEFFGPQLALEFVPATLDGIAADQHIIFADGEQVDTTTEFVGAIVNGLVPASYEISMTGVNDDGAESPTSGSVTASTQNTAAPVAPMAPIAAVDGPSVSIRWTTIQLNDGGNLYRLIGDDIGQSSEPVAPDVRARDGDTQPFSEAPYFGLEPYGNQLNFDNLAPGTYSVQLISVDRVGRESAASTPIVFTVRGSTVV